MPKCTGLKFPSGLSVLRAKRRAKDQLKSGVFTTLSEAQDCIALKEVGLPWAKAMYLINDQSKNPAKNFMTVSDIKSVMQDIPELTRYGYGANINHGMSYKDYLADIDRHKEELLDAVNECNRACIYLQLLSRRKTINTSFGSYTLKHCAEHYLELVEEMEDYYIANGSFMCAAHFMGFDLKRKSTGSPNAFINFSLKSPVIEWESLRRGREVSRRSIQKLDRIEKLLGLPRSELVESYSYLL